MKAVKALYIPAFLVLVLTFVSMLSGWLQLMHVGFMPPQWMAWRIFAMIACLFIGLAWFDVYDCSKNLNVVSIVIVAPWVLYVALFGLGSIALWHPWIEIVTPDAFYYLRGASYLVASILLILEPTILTRYW